MAQNSDKKQINISCLTKILSLLSKPKTLNYLETKISRFLYLTSELEEDQSRLRCLGDAALLVSAVENRSWGTRSRAETSARGPEIFLLESR